LLKTSHEVIMKHLLLVIAVAFAGTVGAQITATTRPFGFNAVKSLGNSDTRFSAPVQLPTEFQGLVQAVGGNTVTVQSPVNWTTSPPQFVYVAGTQPKTYRVEFTSGNRAGAYYTVTGNGSGTLTLDLQGDVIDEPDGVVPGDSLMVVPYWTLGTLFASLQGITTTTDITGSGALTLVLLPDDTAPGVNLSYATYFYYAGTASGGPGWRKAGGSATDIRNDDVILPERHVILRQQGVGTDQMVVAGGFIPTNTRRYELGTLAASTAQDNPLALDVPTAYTLAQSNLIGGGALTGTGSLSGGGDQVLVWDDTVAGTNKSPAKTYFYYTGTGSGGPGWRLMGDAATTLHNNDAALQPGSGFVIRKQATTTPSSVTWAVPNPYNPSLMISPVVGRVLLAATSTFNWAATAGATQYTLWIGSSAGASDLDSSTAVGQNLSRTATLPYDGRALYLTLRALVSGVWQSSSYVDLAASPTWRYGQLSSTAAAVGASGITVDPGDLFAYFKGADNRLWVLWSNNGAWSSTGISPAVVGGDIAVDSSNHFVWFRGTDSRLYVTWWTGSAYATGAVSGPNVAGNVVVDPTSHSVWYRSTDAKLYLTSWTGTAYGNQPVASTNVAGDVLVDSGNQYVWYRGTDARLYVTWPSGTGYANGFVSGPNVAGNVVLDPGNHYLWYRGTDSKLYVTWWTGSTYGNGAVTPANVAGDLALDPVNHYVWYRGTTGGLQVTWPSGPGFANGVIAGSSVAGNVIVDPAYHFIWYRGTDSRLYVTWWTGSTYAALAVTSANVLDSVSLLPSGSGLPFILYQNVVNGVERTWWN
jgi:uncharacterized protein (TIGR02597 family)